MRRVVACLVLAVAIAGCGDDGGGGESGWQDELRDQSRVDLNAPDAAAGVLQICLALEGDANTRDELKAALVADYEVDGSSYEGSGRPLNEILADNDLQVTAAILDEAAEIYVEEIERACP